MERNWDVLLVGGPSSVGKSTAAKEIARGHGVTWMQVDDLRIALQWSRARLPDPADTRKLYFFDQPGVRRLSPERLRDGFIGVGEALSPALAKVITNHVAIAEPLVLEGDGILPSLLLRPDVLGFVATGRVCAVFLEPPDEETYLANMTARDHASPGGDPAELRAHARASWMFGLWLAAQARRLNLLTVPTAPLERLGERILDAIDQADRAGLPRGPGLTGTTG